MKKSWAIVLSVIFLTQFVLAFDLKVNSTTNLGTVFSERGGNASFSLDVLNNDSGQQVQIYSLVGVKIFPDGYFTLNNGRNTLEITAIPSETIVEKIQDFRFEYQIRGDISGIYKDSLLIKIISMADAINLTSMDVKPGDDKIEVVVKNMYDAPIENVSLELSSIFFGDKTIDLNLEPFGQESYNLDILTDNVKVLKTGEYDLIGNLVVDGKRLGVSGNIDYIEQSGITYSEKTSGFFVKQSEMKKTNEGNTPAVASIVIKKDILTRLFTSYSVEPKNSHRDGFFVAYSWDKNLQPSESLVVTAKTNYTIPFIIIILIVIVGFVAKVYSLTDLSVQKKVSYVKTKGGEFALKITLHVKARRHADKIQIIDVLPGMTQIYEKYGRRPDRIDPTSRRLFWDIDHLNAGEERVFSYIIYSKVRAVGNFELPAATAIYERQGITKESRSNRTFFVSEAGNVE